MRILYSKNYPKTAYGITYEKRLEPEYIKPRWVLVIYFYKWYRVWSNYPLPL